LLSQEFASVTLRTLDVPLSIPSAQPVITYVDSLREPTLAVVCCYLPLRQLKYSRAAK
jgi:hypothetical protein